MEVKKIDCMAIYKDNADRGFWDERGYIFDSADIDCDDFFKKMALSQILFLIMGEVLESVEKHKPIDSSVVGVVCKIQDDETFRQQFEGFVKDSFEDEIADAAIRAADFIGFVGIGSIKIHAPESMLPISCDTSEKEAALMLCHRINTIHEFARKSEKHFSELKKDVAAMLIAFINDCAAVADNYGFDLSLHVAGKLRYNRMRGYKHGKKF